MRTAELIAKQSAVYKLRTPYRDGTTHFVFEPLDFLARLAALVPRPRGNLVRYHGILAPNAKHRNAVTPNPSTRKRQHPSRAHVHSHALDEDHREDDSNTPTSPMTWMEQLRRVLAIDLSVCPRCGGRLRFIAGGRLREPTFGSRLSGADCRMSHDRM